MPKHKRISLVDRARSLFRQTKSDATGPRGEREAARFLKRAGYKLLAKNLRHRLGEIDLLMLAPDKKSVVLVEVKSASNRKTLIKPEERVGKAKQRKLSVLAFKLIQKHKLQGRPIRIDVVGVDLYGDKPAEVRHYINAFEAAW